MADEPHGRFADGESEMLRHSIAFSSAFGFLASDGEPLSCADAFSFSAAALSAAGVGGVVVSGVLYPSASESSSSDVS